MRRRRDRYDTQSRSSRFEPVTTLDSYLRVLEDRRYYDPLPDVLRVPRAFPQEAARIRAKSSPVKGVRNDTLSHRVGFAVPDRVAMCVRRKQRREVIHALGKSGSGGSRRRRRNAWSDVDC